MVISGRHYVKERAVGRRKDDLQVRDRIHKHDLVFQVGQIITSEINMDVLFDVIMDQTNRIIGTERSTVFLHDKN